MNSNPKISAIAITVCGILMGVAGLLFKVMHWPGSKVMTTAALPLMIVGVVLIVVRSRKGQ